MTEELVFRSTILAASLLGGLSTRSLVFGTPLWFGIAHAHHALEVWRQGGKTTQAAIQASAGCGESPQPQSSLLLPSLSPTYGNTNASLPIDLHDPFWVVCLLPLSSYWQRHPAIALAHILQYYGDISAFYCRGTPSRS